LIQVIYLENFFFDFMIVVESSYRRAIVLQGEGKTILGYFLW